MGRQAENSYTLPDGRVIGYGLIPPKQRAGYWRVRFHGGKKGERVERSTGATSKGEARTRAQALIREHFNPAAPRVTPTGWDEAMTRLAGVNHLRPATLESYAKAVRAFRRVVPSPAGPGEVTADDAATFLHKYRPKSANTVRNALRHLSSLWRKHFKTLKLVTVNPWADVAPPPAVRNTPRAPTDETLNEFFAYLEERYPGWELVTLFVRAKAFIGCRTADLCGVLSEQLRDGRLHFHADQTKTHTARSAPLPPDLYAALDRLKGPTYLWEAYAADAATYRRNQNKTKPNPFTPSLLYWGVGNIFAEFNRSRPGKPRLRPHDLRRLALTRAALAFGADVAAKAIGVDP